jgi:hypothetical protein
MKSTEIEALSWQEFADLKEVCIDQAPYPSDGNALFYTDESGEFSACVAIDEGKYSPDFADQEVWLDEDLIKSLQNSVVSGLRAMEDYRKVTEA